MSRNAPEIDFGIALKNWRASQAAKAEKSGYHETCGSAERAYAGHPERFGRQADEEVEMPVNERMADRFERLVSRLPNEERAAWHIRMGFRDCPKGADTAALQKLYLAARTRLAVWWMGVTA